MEEENKIRLEQLQSRYTEQKQLIPSKIFDIKETQTLLNQIVIVLLIIFVVLVASLLFNPQIEDSKIIIIYWIMTVVSLLILVLIIMKSILYYTMKKHHDEYDKFQKTKMEFQNFLYQLFEIKLNEIKLIENSTTILNIKIWEGDNTPSYVSELPELYVDTKISGSSHTGIELFDNNVFDVKLKSAHLAYYINGVKTKIQNPPGWYVYIVTKKTSKIGVEIQKVYYNLL
ncbi:MAG: hypothetical protein GXP45_04625 [bacterium]|nr:hypothetical protein [bacterium]